MPDQQEKLQVLPEELARKIAAAVNGLLKDAKESFTLGPFMLDEVKGDAKMKGLHDACPGGKWMIDPRTGLGRCVKPNS
ncbi:hypothetical protein GFS24_20180 [Chitinophaga sp. SYP-B3965]|uniref:hypothetical protein n=1 Tax=Chitinophaga sp. SYP-B3965 TaxID=2663120 RepID=UPI00129986B6|nr:hypothetical protein [Chitinophaga sp. SYP-B3965]MRG47450.1 hypothetical protein [Chitinophaga sp. SYP-B3965]